jgi:hypothetical protein
MYSNRVRCWKIICTSRDEKVEHFNSCSASSTEFSRERFTASAILTSQVRLTERKQTAAYAVRRSTK